MRAISREIIRSYGLLLILASTARSGAERVWHELYGLSRMHTFWLADQSWYSVLKNQSSRAEDQALADGAEPTKIIKCSLIQLDCNEHQYPWHDRSYILSFKVPRDPLLKA